MTKRKRCGNCVRFYTPKCTFAYSAESINPKTKIVNTMKEFLDNFYDFTPEPVPYHRLVSNYNIILPTDEPCAGWEEL